jgi:hypothetical protein
MIYDISQAYMTKLQSFSTLTYALPLWPQVERSFHHTMSSYLNSEAKIKMLFKLVITALGSPR